METGNTEIVTPATGAIKGGIGMAKTVKITTDNLISVVEVPWDVEAQGEMIGADCTETVKTQRMYDLFKDYVVMIVDESGIIKERPFNSAASYLYGADIHGCGIAGDVLFGIQRGPEILPPDDVEVSGTVRNRGGVVDEEYVRRFE